jgi:hypothetical protein
MATQAELMKAYRPRRPGTTLEDVVTPEERERRASMVKEVQDEKDREKIKGMGYANGGVTRADGCITKGHTRGRMV